MLIVDVGTNAELLLGDKRRVLACSSPTGPAFEGAQISSGQRAAPGAIDAIRIDPQTKEPRYRIIGSDLWSDEEGFAEAVAENRNHRHLRVGHHRGRGRVAHRGPAGPLRAARIRRTDRDAAHDSRRAHPFLCHSRRQPWGQSVITVTQGDIRAIQLAKSALYAGARLLMDEMGVDAVDRVVLAGAFGAHISARHALVLGMIPDVPLDKVTSAGNAAGTGARIALCNLSARAEIEGVVRRITKVETAIEPRFQEHFVAANAIPHKTDPFAELSRTTPLPNVTFNASGAREGRRRRRS